MKKVFGIFGLILLMAAAFFLLTNAFLYIANRPLDRPALANVKVQETEQVKQFIAKTHESFNGYLNYGKADHYTDGDWKYLKQWFNGQESELKDLEKQVKNEKLKQDVRRSYEITKQGIETTNIQYVIYGHRIYHDLDIIINHNQKEQNIWGYTEFGNGANVKVVEDELAKFKKS
ncbi:hypothetical protein [Ectobacillus polymachus]|uniref:hypothetical protein n=1 Tax=Ectobacillus polymachus TaxID=1508806 RepID=UPI003A8A1846